MEDFSKKRVSAPPQPFDTPTTLAGQKAKKRPILRPVLFFAIITLLLIIITGCIYWLGRSKTSIASYDQNKWQAIFLTNSQVYFGHITAQTKSDLILENIYYYPQNFLNLLQGGEEKQLNDLSIFKLGNELHGPADQMIINRSSVMFVENLKENSKVLQAIIRYQEKIK